MTERAASPEPRPLPEIAAEIVRVAMRIDGVAESLNTSLLDGACSELKGLAVQLRRPASASPPTADDVRRTIAAYLKATSPESPSAELIADAEVERLTNDLEYADAKEIANFKRMVSTGVCPYCATPAIRPPAARETAATPTDTTSHEIGWLIERTVNGVAEWWNGDPDHFTRQANKATRFARHEDADTVIIVLQIPRVEAVEHMWAAPDTGDTPR